MPRPRAGLSVPAGLSPREAGHDTSGRPLVVVESPAKRARLAAVLGSSWDVVATQGHVRDLPSRPSEVPEHLRSEPWAALGLDTSEGGGYAPVYVRNQAGSKHLDRIEALGRSAAVILLATDRDREGAAIAQAVVEEARLPLDRVRRLELQELTREGFEDALSRTGEIDRPLVEAQEARRAVDRLYGYRLSPLMWRRVERGSSVGRVQSAASAMISARELERLAFVPSSVTRVEAELEVGTQRVLATLVSLGGMPVANHTDHDPQTGRPGAGLRLPPDITAQIGQALRDAPVRFESRGVQDFSVHAPDPYTTATLLQDLSEQYGWSARQASRISQSLYERGLISYIRTDATGLSGAAVDAIREALSAHFGAETAALIVDRGAQAQGTHEGIRPAGAHIATPESLRARLSDEERQAYEAIYHRALASQLGDLSGQRETLEFSAQLPQGQAQLRCVREHVAEPGFQRIYGMQPGASWTLSPEQHSHPEAGVLGRVQARGLP